MTEPKELAALREENKVLRVGLATGIAVMDEYLYVREQSAKKLEWALRQAREAERRVAEAREESDGS